MKYNLELIPCSYLLEGELIHWVGKAENVGLRVGQLPIKAEW